jgi:PAS domain S-box-containing protein
VRDAVNDISILRSVLDRSPDMIVLCEMSGRVLYVNQAGLTLVGLAELPVAQPTLMTEFFTSSGLAKAGEVESALTCSREWRGLTELKNFVTNQPIPVEIAAFIVDRGHDEPSVIVSIVRDRGVLWEAIVEASEYRAAEQQAVAELSTIALDGELDQLLDAATMAASKLMGVHRSMITRPIEGNDDRIAVVGFTGQAPRPPTLPAGTQSLMGYTLITNAVVVCEDRDEETRFSTAAMASYGFRSGVCVPIPGAQGPWGALSVHSNLNRIYSDRDVSFLRTVASVLSAAIRRLHLDRLLHERSMHDPLTGLPNRTLAYERIERALAPRRT